MRHSTFRFLVAVSLLTCWLAGVTVGRPRYGGTLRVEMREVVRNLDPADWFADAAEAAAKEKLVSLIFESLVRVNENGHPQPGLALSWQHDSEFKRWRFRLRENVRFHDGSPMTAEIVVTALHAANDPWQLNGSADELVVESDLPIPDLLFDLARGRRTVFIRGADGKISGTGPFRLSQWEPGRRAVLAADEQHWSGRPFLDAVTIEMGRPPREQLLDLELGKADFVEILPNDVRRAAQRGTRIWSSSADILIALAFERGRPAAEDARLREAIALSIDRTAMHTVLLQKQGEPAVALLPQRLSGYAFLFSAAADPKRARQLVASLGPSLQPLSLAFDASDPLARAMAERIAVNARETGITLSASGQASRADLTLLYLPVPSLLPGPALSDLISSLHLSEIWQSPRIATAEACYALERAILDSYRVIPLFHLPQTFGSSPRLRTWMTPGMVGSSIWRFDDFWLDMERP
jgi:peptide/nickel transport system substrate-binding protein